MIRSLLTLTTALGLTLAGLMPLAAQENAGPEVADQAAGASTPVDTTQFFALLAILAILRPRRAARQHHR